MAAVKRKAPAAPHPAIMVPTTQERRLALVALFVVSASGLVFEITLTRLFSLFFQYHFTFLAVSLAVLGLSAGAASAHYIPTSRRHSAQQPVIVLIGLSLALSAATMIIAWLPSADSIFPRAMVALVVFFLIGLFDALTFVRFTVDSSTFYAADLIGAALGVVAVLWLLSVWSAFSMTLFLAAVIGGLALLVAVRTPFRGHRSPLVLVAAGGAVLGVGLLTVNLLSGIIDFNPTQITGVTRDKTMVSILQDPAQSGRILYTAYSPFARVDVIQTNDASSRYIFADGGAGAYMVNYDNNPQTLDRFRNTVEFLPYTGANANNTLVIGAGGGKDILLALEAAAQHVTAVEVNPAVVTATRYFGAYNGHVLDLPVVNLVEGDARSFAERTTDHFDMIYLSLVYTQAVEPASQALVENYIFTRQAMATYINRLSPGGRLAIVSHNGLEGSRAAVTAIQAMQDIGIAPTEALDHLWLWRYPASDATISTTVLIVSKDALSKATLQSLNGAARAQGMQPLYSPGDYETLFSTLRKGQPLSTFIQAGGAYNLSPTDDDQPYFFNLDYGLPAAISSALIIAVLLAVGLLIVGVLAQTTDQTAPKTHSRQSWLFIGYGALIGLGFMLIEVPLIQRFQLLLGQPILSLAVVLATLLLAGGLGSAISQRWLVKALPTRIALAGVWIAAAAIIYWFALPGLLNTLLATSFAVRLLAICVFTALIGLPMGIPFPGLLRMAADDQAQIALLWAINGAFSVLGSTLALVISMQWGFRWAMIGGAAAYVLMAGLVMVLQRVRQPGLAKQVVVDNSAVSQT
jgi:predicted membrane-bound spermidine synthase